MPLVRRSALLGSFFAAVLGSALPAQGLRSRISTELFTFGTCGDPLCLEGSQLVGHGGHFIPAQVAGTGGIISFLSNAIGVSVTNVPVSAASSGATFSFEAGVPVKTSSSSGPIFAERAQTLGRGRFFIGANVTGLHFDRLRGVRLDGLELNFAHEDIPPAGLGNPGFEADLIQVRVAMDIDLLVTSVFAAWGLVDGLDLAVSVPMVHTSVRGRSVAQVLPFGSGVGTPHYFGTDASGNPILSAVGATEGSATGIGDVAARLKINVFQSGKVGVALLADGRFPTGDEENLLGAGRFAGRGLGIVSLRFGSFSPHANVGYVFRDADLENNGVLATVGFDHLLGSWATMAAELISEWQVGASKLQLPGPILFTEPFPRTVLSSAIPDQRDNPIAMSLGFKFSTPRGITFVANALIPLRDAGLQPSAVWTGGLEYNF
jgi:hypothetical protein